MRKLIFQENLAKVAAHNSYFAAGKHGWFMAMNEYADWTPQELSKLRAAKYSPIQHPTIQLDKDQPNPVSMDWRQKGAISKVKNQGGCGSCWAFAATESVESHYQIASGKLLDLAPQTYVNCAENPHQCGGTGGCEGATAQTAFNMTITKGIALESDLPYEGHDEKCSAFKPAVKVSGYVGLPSNNADALETALATKGPISVSVAADAWALYGGGVFSGCSDGGAVNLDHAVQAVGYTTDYWIVRNSWGPAWGEDGYIYLSRASDSKTFTDDKPADGSACKPFPMTQTVGGECGVLFDTCYPTGVAVAADEIVVV